MKRDTARDHLACAMHVIIADRRSLQLTREYLRENYGRPGQNLAQAMDNRYKSPQGLGRLNGPAITRARTHTETTAIRRAQLRHSRGRAASSPGSMKGKERNRKGEIFDSPF